jgi:hypothetical protein
MTNARKTKREQSSQGLGNKRGDLEVEDNLAPKRQQLALTKFKAYRKTRAFERKE